MKKICKSIIAVTLAASMVFCLMFISSFATEADIAMSTSADSCKQGENITVQIYFPAEVYDAVASMDMNLSYDSSQLEVISVKKGDGLKAASDAQVNGDYVAEGHKTAGMIKWSLAGADSYKFSGQFAEIEFKVRKNATHGACELKLNVTSAANANREDITSGVNVQGTSFTIIRVSENDMTFTLNSDKTGYIISGYLCGTCDYVDIPAVHEGLPVVEIGTAAFFNHAEIKTLTMPEGIETIGYQAFSGCSGIENLVISNTVTKIDNMAFMNCSGLRTVEMSVAVESIGASAFFGCPFLKSIELPFTLKTMGTSVFENCISLENIRISKNTTSIGKRTFYNCSDFLKITTVSGNTYLSDYISTNSVNATLNIVEDLSLGTASKVEDQQLTVEPVEPTVNVSLTNGKTVTAGTDYKIVYVGNKTVGNAKLYVIGIDGYYEGYIVDFSIYCDHPTTTKTVGKEATCTADGYYDCVCDICGDTTTEVIPATGHSSDKWVYDILPTISKTGLKHQVCDVCGDSFNYLTKADKIFPDINGDKVINSSDALAILLYSTGTVTALNTEEKRLNADTNGDKMINSVDALAVLQIAIGQIKL